MDFDGTYRETKCAKSERVEQFDIFAAKYMFTIYTKTYTVCLLYRVYCKYAILGVQDTEHHALLRNVCACYSMCSRNVCALASVLEMCLHILSSVVKMCVDILGSMVETHVHIF